MLVFTYPSNAGTLRSLMAAGSARATTVKMHRSSQLVAQPLVETGGGASPVGSPTKTSVAEVFTLASDADSVLKEAADRAVDAGGALGRRQPKTLPKIPDMSRPELGILSGKLVAS